jgi:hypothetical protein
VAIYTFNGSALGLGIECTKRNICSVATTSVKRIYHLYYSLIQEIVSTKLGAFISFLNNPFCESDLMSIIQNTIWRSVSSKKNSTS